MGIREEFVLRAQAPEANIAGLCREYGVSRKTGYKWLERFKEQGLSGLEDLSRKPKESPLAVSGGLVADRALAHQMVSDANNFSDRATADIRGDINARDAFDTAFDAFTRENNAAIQDEVAAYAKFTGVLAAAGVDNPFDDAFARFMQDAKNTTSAANEVLFVRNADVNPIIGFATDAGNAADILFRVALFSTLRDP